MSWYALQCTPQSEFKAVQSIERMAVTAVCPIVIERRVRHRRSATVKQEISKPLFTGYVFVEMGYLPAWIYQEKHVIRPLTYPIPAHLMLNALKMSGEITVNEWREVQKFHRGESVKLRSGLPAIVDDVRGAKLILLVELLGKIHRKSVMADQVEAAE
jgi:transcription antitermination factor NusG